MHDLLNQPEWMHRRPAVSLDEHQHVSLLIRRLAHHKLGGTSARIGVALQLIEDVIDLVRDHSVTDFPLDYDHQLVDSVVKALHHVADHRTVKLQQDDRDWTEFGIVPEQQPNTDSSGL